MTVVNFNYPKFKYTIASTGQPGAGYKLFTYEEGTSTKKTTWTSLAKTAENTNPIILDANGEADVWVDGNYKFVLAPPTDTDPPASPVWTYDAIRSTNGGSSVSSGTSVPTNGSFETDSDADNVPDNWTVAALSGGTIAIDSTSSTHGTNSLKFTSTGSGGGTASTDDYYEVEAGDSVGVRFSIISADADTLNKVEVYWYDSSKVFLSSTAAYNEGAANPTSWTRKDLSVTAPASAKYARIILTGVDAASTTHSSTNFDNIELDAGITANMQSLIDEKFDTYQVQLFTSSGTWNKPAGLKYVKVTVVGAGGAGGGASNSASSCGGGGGSGSAAISIIAAASLGATETVTIGSGGTAVAAGDGGAGGTSSYGAHVSCNGGTGGKAGYPIGGSGLLATTGDIKLWGRVGQNGTAAGATTGGNGGNSLVGKGGLGAAPTSISDFSSNGSAGVHGGGGGGAFNTSSGVSNTAGGAGGDGIVIVEEFIGG